MQRPRIIIASVAVAAVAAIGGVTAAAASGSPASSATPSNSATPSSSAPAASGATVHTLQATVNGKTETILVNAQGLPLYYYQPDTAAKSLVAGQLAAAWPPVTSAMPTGSGLSGQLTAVNDTHGSQVAYNGHLLYTFITDRPGQVTGQGVQNFFVATPGIAQLSGTSAPTGTVPAVPASPSSPAAGGYGY
jgi:predicted lipoprotein with Yx(FWY)xxD motif